VFLCKRVWMAGSLRQMLPFQQKREGVARGLGESAGVGHLIGESPPRVRDAVADAEPLEDRLGGGPLVDVIVEGLFGVAPVADDKEEGDLVHPGKIAPGSAAQEPGVLKDHDRLGPGGQGADADGDAFLLGGQKHCLGLVVGIGEFDQLGVAGVGDVGEQGHAPFDQVVEKPRRPVVLVGLAHTGC